MINIKTSFFSLLVDIVGKEEIPLSFDNPLTIREILVQLSSMIGKNFEENMFDLPPVKEEKKEEGEA